MNHPDWCKIAIIDGRIVLEENVRRCRFEECEVVWTGFVFDEKGRCDDDAISEFVKSLGQEMAVELAAARLRGTFFLTLRNAATGTTYSFVDDSGLFTAYRCPRGVSTSFVELCQRTGVTATSFSRSAVLELLHLGNVYFGDTLCPELKKLAAHEIVVQSPNDVKVINKPIPSLSDDPAYITIEDATEPLAMAIRDKRVSVDLTGGFDSRMLACLLVAHGVEIEAALSGSGGSKDATLGRQVAMALNIPYHFCEYDGSAIAEDLDYTLERLDGMGGLILINHRLLQLNQDRISRGINVSLKGSGGELYKDFFWAQDFPFYRSRKTRMDRLSRMRLEFELLTANVLTSTAMSEFASLQLARRRRLESSHQMPMNTQSYDNVYFYERVQTWNSRAITSTQDPRLAIHSPLSELRVAQLGFHAPHMQRFYNRFHRGVITRVSPRAAKVLTTDGTTASANTTDLLRDATGYARGKAAKFAKKMAQLLINKTRFAPPLPYSPNLEFLHRLGRTDVCHRALEALKEADIIRPSISLTDLSPRFQEHAISTGWVLQRLA